MKYITYQDYLNYKKYLFLREESEEYELKEYPNDKIYAKEKIRGIDKKHDKMLKKILSNKKEIIKFLKDFIGLKNRWQEKDFILSPTEFITKDYEEKRSDLLYKLKNKPVYFLIEHQSTKDKKMVERIGKYVEEIMIREVKKNIYPIVIPIVIYTGFQNWNVETNFGQKQYSSAKYEKYKINFSYNLIAVQDYTFQELFKKKSLFASFLIIEKCKTKEEIENQINKIIELITDLEDKEILSEILVNIIRPIIGKEKTEKLLQKLKGKEEIGMSPCAKLTLDLQYEAKMEGIKTGIINTAKKMLEKNMNVKDIEEVTGLSQKEIKNLLKK